MIGYKRIKPVQIIDEVNITNVEYDDTAEIIDEYEYSEIMPYEKSDSNDLSFYLSYSY